MRKVKWAIWGILVLLVAGLLNYTMPQHDVVRITEAYNRQTSVSWANKYFYASPDAGTAESGLPRWLGQGLSQRGYRLDLATLFQIRQL
jgi:hypothetical protein